MRDRIEGKKKTNGVLGEFQFCGNPTVFLRGWKKEKERRNNKKGTARMEELVAVTIQYNNNNNNNKGRGRAVQGFIMYAG